MPGFFRRAAALSGALLVCLPAAAAAQPRQSFEGRFSATTPASASGMSISIRYTNPDDPGAKPPAVQEVLTELHPGTVLDTAVPARCTASDAELILLGESACPAGSRVGGGQLDLDTGTPLREVRTDVVLLNAEDQLIFLLKLRGAQARVDPLLTTTATLGPRPRIFVSRARVGERTIVTEVPPTPGGPPDFMTAIKRAELVIDRVVTGQGAYLTTPPACPPAGTWTNRASFDYADGVSQTVASPSPCGG